jgi:hypothetical protein
MMKVQGMSSRATKLPTTSAGMAMPSKNFSFYKTIMRMFLTSMDTFRIWARMVHGESTQRCTLQQFYAADITIYANEYASNGGSLIFMADGPNAKCNTNHAM